jgi:hypothetical protein
MPVTASTKRRLAVPASAVRGSGLFAGQGRATSRFAVELAATFVTVRANPVNCVFVALPTPEDDRSHQ